MSLQHNFHSWKLGFYCMFESEFYPSKLLSFYSVCVMSWMFLCFRSRRQNGTTSWKSLKRRTTLTPGDGNQDRTRTNCMPSTRERVRGYPATEFSETHVITGNLHRTAHVHNPFMRVYVHAHSYVCLSVWEGILWGWVISILTALIMPDHSVFHTGLHVSASVWANDGLFPHIGYGF